MIKASQAWLKYKNNNNKKRIQQQKINKRI